MSLDVVLWLLAVALWGVGDVYTTVVGGGDDLEERSPVVRRLLGPEPSLAGFCAFKAVSLALFAGAYAVVAAPSYASAIPALLAAVGAVATASNLWRMRRVRRRRGG